MRDIGCVPVNMGGTIMRKKESNYFVKYIKIFLWACILSGFILLMDIYNMPSSVINKIPMEAKIIFAVIFVVAIILACCNVHLLELCRLPYVNMIDMASICIMCISIICAFVWIFSINQYIYKWSTALSFCVLSLVIIIVRGQCIKKVAKNGVDNNLYDLKDIYEGKKWAIYKHQF